MQKSKLKMESTLLLGQGKHKSTNLLNAKRRNWEGKELHLITQQKGRLQLPASEGQMSLSKNSHNNQDTFTQKDTILFRVQFI
jgi:hypothetical protein